MNRIRAAVVGVGYLGKFHAEKYAAHPDVDLVAVVDNDLARAQSVGGALSADALTDWRALVGRVDCATVAVPTIQHHAVGCALLDAGIDVLLEKPMASNVEEGKSLLESAVRGQRLLQIGHLERFNPALRPLDGKIKEPRFIECQRLAPFMERGTDVDVVLDLMIHDLDLILSMVPSSIRAVEAAGVPVLTDSVDIANARLRFANGCIADVTASRVSLKRERKLRVFQQDAYFSIDFDERRARICHRLPVPNGPPSLHFDEIETQEGDALAAEVDAFVQAVRNRSVPRVTGWDGLRALDLAHVIRESVETEVRIALAGSPGR
jgi:predicted dehydrogenase